MDIISALLSFSVPTVCVVLGIILFSSLFFDELFGNKLRPNARTGAVTAGILLVITGLGLIIADVIAKNREEATVTEEKSEDRVETLSAQLYTINGQDDPNYGNGTGRLFITKSEGADIAYKFEYRLPKDQPGYSGFVFKFDPPLDVTKYSTLVVSLTRNDNSANCEINLKKGDAANYIRICDGSFYGGEGVTSEGSIPEGNFTVFIPLRLNFDDVDQRNVDELGISANSGFTSGVQSFTINEIKFIK